MCHRKIPNGQKFCESCKQRRKTKADESYLDSLLSSVGENQADSKQDTGKNGSFGAYPAYTDNNSISKGGRNTGYAADNNSNRFDNVQADNQNYDNTAADSNPEMDDMLSDLLNDMDEAGSFDQQPESNIGEEDIENIFDEAEAYAELLSKNNGAPDAGSNSEETGTNRNTDLFEHLDSTTAQPNDQDFIDLDWNNGQGEDSNLQGTGEGAEFEPDNGYNEEDDLLLNEGLLGENPDLNSEEVFSDFDPLSEEIEAEAQPKKKKKKKLSWFKRLFGNVNDEVTPEMIETDKAKKAEEEELEKKKREEKKKLDEERKAEQLAEKERKKAEADAERNRKLALAIEKKNAAKEKEKKKKEQALAIAEYELEHGKINKAGATILFVIFAILTIVIIIGTNIYSYNLSIENAREDFAVKKYNEAYYDVYGYDLKIKESGVEQDIMLYDKIMTVMYVNSQLNSYEYYMTSNNREKALDSLLKGLQKYDKYLRLAQELDITTDLDYVKSEILEKLDTEFKMTEQDAEKLVANLDPVDYSEYLYHLIGDYEDELKKYK